MKRNETAIIICKIIQKIQFIIGVFLIIPCTCCVVYAIIVRGPDEIVALPAFIVLEIILILLLVFSKKRKYLIVELNKYLGIISSNHSVSIVHIAEELGESNEIVRKNLKKLIKKNYLTNAYINYETNFVKSIDAASPKQYSDALGDTQPQEYPQPQKYPQPQEQSQQQGYSQRPPVISKIEYVHITCSHCGGVTKIIKGTTGKCDYCGSPIE